MDNLLSGLTGWFPALYTGVLRYCFWALGLIILLRVGQSLLTFRREPELWAFLVDDSGTRYPVEHWESILGRGRRSDVRLPDPAVSRTHGVLTRYDDGSWTIGDAGSKNGLFLNGESVGKLAELRAGDRLVLGQTALTFLPLSAAQTAKSAENRTRAGWDVGPGGTLFFITLFQLLTALQLMLAVEDRYAGLVALSFGVLCMGMWVLFLVMRLVGLRGFEVESVAFFLCTLGLSVIASSNPGELPKQLIAIGGGILIYLIVGWSLRDLERARLVRYLASAAGVLLLACNVLFGKEVNGAKNWIYFGSWSFQPSELVKICLVYAGAASMQSMVRRRNLWGFIVYAGVCCICLALLNDFGTALLFFVTFLVIAFMRSGDWATLSFICAGTGYAAVLAVRFRPYVVGRFAAWRHVWEYALEGGYQQTRAMMCIAAGGLFGLGAGNGWLKYVAAADTDLVFGLVGEEWGLLMAVIMALDLVILAAFAVRAASVIRSGFHAIGACAAMTMLLFSAMLNVFGTVDFLPLTGVTFPFVSNGGSSMLSAWGLLAFVKGADTRREASFALRAPGSRPGVEDPAEEEDRDEPRQDSQDRDDPSGLDWEDEDEAPETEQSGLCGENRGPRRSPAERVRRGRGRARELA